MDELHGRLLWTTLPFTGDFTDCGVLVHVDSLLGRFFVQTALITMDDLLDEQELGSFFCFPIKDNNEDHIEVDAEQAYSRRESNTPMVEEVDNDNVVEVDVAEVYSRRHGKEPMTQHPSEDNDVIDSSDSGGGDGKGSVEDEDVVNHAEREFVEDSSDS